MPRERRPCCPPASRASERKKLGNGMARAGELDRRVPASRNGPGPAPPQFQWRLDIVNAALFMLTSAWMAGADAAPAAPAPGAPAVVSTGSACGGPACCDTGCGKVSLFSRLCGRRAKDCCDACPPPPPPCKHARKPAPCGKPAPVCKPVCPPPPPCCKPAPVCHDVCDSGCGRVGLWSRIKGRHARDCCDACGPAPCGAPGHPEVIPPPKDKGKDKGKGGVTGIYVEPIVTPAVAPRPPIEIGGPVNPF